MKPAKYFPNRISSPYCPYCQNKICNSGKRLTAEEWDRCPWQKANTKSMVEWCLLPRFITEWWYFRKFKPIIKIKIIT